MQKVTKKIRVVEKEVYVAEDGREFDSEWDCNEHEEWLYNSTDYIDSFAIAFNTELEQIPMSKIKAYDIVYFKKDIPTEHINKFLPNDISMSKADMTSSLSDSYWRAIPHYNRYGDLWATFLEKIGKGDEIANIGMRIAKILQLWQKLNPISENKRPISYLPDYETTLRQIFNAGCDLRNAASDILGQGNYVHVQGYEHDWYGKIKDEKVKIF